MNDKWETFTAHVKKLYVQKDGRLKVQYIGPGGLIHDYDDWGEPDILQANFDSLADHIADSYQKLKDAK